MGRPTGVKGPASNMGRLDCKFPSRQAFYSLSKTANAFVSITEDESLRETHSLLNNNWPTVPMITYCDGETERFIGGYTDLINEIEQKEEK